MESDVCVWLEDSHEWKTDCKCSFVIESTSHKKSPMENVKYCPGCSREILFMNEHVEEEPVLRPYEVAVNYLPDIISVEAVSEEDAIRVASEAVSESAIDENNIDYMSVI